MLIMFLIFFFKKLIFAIKKFSFQILGSQKCLSFCDVFHSYQTPIYCQFWLQYILRGRVGSAQDSFVTEDFLADTNDATIIQYDRKKWNQQ